MNPQTILSSFKEAMGSAILEDRTIERASLHDAVAHLCAEFDPHLSVISGDDLGDEVAFNYHFSAGWGERYGEITFTIRAVVPKSDFRLPTICDLLPGAQTSEREKHEFYGVEIEGIPDSRNLFLPEGMTIHPWRRDHQSEIDKEVKRLVKWEARDE